MPRIHPVYIPASSNIPRELSGFVVGCQGEAAIGRTYGLSDGGTHRENRLSKPDIILRVMFAQTTTHATLLAKLVHGGEPSAWREFVDRYGELIRGFAVRQYVKPVDCEDIVQDVLLALTRTMPNFQYDPAKGKFRSYLKTAVVHAIYRKSFQSRGEVSLEEVDATSRAAGADPDVEGQWESEWRQYHLRLAMKTIGIEFNDADRRAFQMYAVDGRSAAETAESLGQNVDQVYQAKSRIVRRLGELVEQQIAEEG